VFEEDREETAGITGFVCFVVTTMFIYVAQPHLALATLSTRGKLDRVCYYNVCALVSLRQRRGLEGETEVDVGAKSMRLSDVEIHQ
jgi:hypothetical protein